VNTSAAFDPETRRVVEQLLSESWRGEVRSGSVQSLRAGKVYRLEIVEAPPGSPPTVVVKAAAPEPGISVDPDATDGNPAQLLLEEWAGLAFLNAALPGKGLVPAFYGGDRGRCLVVSEDFGPGSTLVDVLTGDDPEQARTSLTMHAQAIAELHAGTVGLEDQYRNIRDSLGPAGVPRDWKQYGIVLDTQGWGDLRSLRSELQAGFARVGQVVPGAFWDEYESLASSLENPSPFRTYVQNDACPDNTLFTSGGVHLVDFERGGYHLSMLDAAYCRLGMPHCFWAGRVPEDVTTAAEMAYRDVLSAAIPAVAEDRLFGRAMTEACAYWIISNGDWLIHRGFENDFDWGSATRRQRVFFRLEQFAAATEQFSHLPSLGAAARETIRRLRRQWEYRPMPLFPAFLDR